MSEALNKDTVVLLDDNKSYLVVDTLSYKNNDYILLAEMSDSSNVVIRKQMIHNNEITLLGLDSEEEFEEVLVKFSIKFIGQ